MVKFRWMVALLGLATLAGVTAPPAAALVKVGQPAPDFELTLVDGSKVTREELRGHVVILNYWATWCAPCREELPLLDAYYRGRKENGLRVYAVATEDSLPIKKLKPLFEVIAIPPARRIKGPFRIMGALPTNYVIDRAGTVRYAKAGAFTLDELNELLVPLLNERPPAAGSGN